jgi:phospholipase/carboxylesterase
MTEFIHLYIPSSTDGGRALLLLHGTGGDENDLIPLGKAIDPNASLLSLRGRVLENGAPRFFRRLAEGVFDEEDVVRRSHELAAFLESAIEKYGIAKNELVAVGYSNGANIASAMMLLGVATFSQAILLRAMVPLTTATPTGSQPRQILISQGEFDPIAPPAQGQDLAKRLRTTGATVDLVFQRNGHELGGDDVATAQNWLLNKGPI